jgi:hypothetical protein
MSTPPRIRGLVDKLERAVKMQLWAKQSEKSARKADVLSAKMDILKAFALLSPKTVDIKPDDGYWCVVCGRFLPAVDGVIVHDNVPHPKDMTFDEEMQ